MKISLIAAMGKNKVIGKNNSLPWHLPADMKRFRELTRNKPIIMGRKTYESIGRPLPDRKNIIITKDKSYRAEGCIIAHSINEALSSAEGADEVMIIGGANVYRQFLPIADKIYLTIIGKDFEGDAYFPQYGNEWREVKKEDCKADAQNPHNYSFLVLEKKISGSKTGENTIYRP